MQIETKKKKEKVGVVILISDKIDFETKTVKRDKEDCIMVKGSIQEEDITIRNIYAPFPGGSEVIIVFACKVGDPGSIPGLGRSPEEGNGNPLQYSCLENGQRSLVGYSLRGRKESDTTEQLHFHFIIGAPQYVRQMLTSMEGEINNNTIIVGDFNTPLTPMDRSTKQKINKETQTLNETVDQMGLIEIIRTLHANEEEYTFF